MRSWVGWWTSDVGWLERGSEMWAARSRALRGRIHLGSVRERTAHIVGVGSLVSGEMFRICRILDACRIGLVARCEFEEDVDGHHLNRAVELLYNLDEAVH